MLAIVIPFYKIRYFDKTLDSLAKQRNKNFTVYIGDDASPEDPKKLIEKYRNELNINYKRFSKNLGGISLVEHWQRCIGMTNEEDWIMILGDDDFLDSSVVEKWYDYYPQFSDEFNLVRFATRLIDENTATISKIYYHPKFENAADSYYRKFSKKTRSSLSEYVFLKEKYETNHFHNYPLGWHSDDRAWLEIAEDKGIFSINDAIINIRNSEINISGRQDNLSAKNSASRGFYGYLLRKKINSYNKEQRLLLILAYEKVLNKLEKIPAKDWFFLFYLYLRNFQKVQFKKFIKRLLISSFKL